MLIKLIVIVIVSNIVHGFIDGDVKLVDGGSQLEGTVLVYRGYGWGAICDDNWTYKEANVICRQLNMGAAVKLYNRNYFESFGINIFMDDLTCKGNEKNVKDCQFPGWGVHDCRPNELVGVACSELPKNKTKVPKDKFYYVYSKSELADMKKRPFQIDFVNQSNGFIIPTIKNGNDKLLICSDNFNSLTWNVLCYQKYKKMAAKFEKISKENSSYVNSKFVLRIGSCYGNETDIFNCVTYYKEDGIHCSSNHLISLKCDYKLPDIRTDYLETERSSYLARVSIFHLKCAITENCLPPIIHKIIEKNPNTHPWMLRNLLRFSSIIENVGLTDFKPLNEPCDWEWHGCHMHYHSMKVFARYEIFTLDGFKISNGLKASFCLEDNICSNTAEKKFQCSTSLEYYGVQGISPGCKDTYYHDYDCQWIDMTDLSYGNYIFQIIINPDFLVPESNFFNNGLRCNLFYPGYNAYLRNCGWVHPNDLLH